MEFKTLVKRMDKEPNENFQIQIASIIKIKNKLEEINK